MTQIIEKVTSRRGDAFAFVNVDLLQIRFAFLRHYLKGIISEFGAPRDIQNFKFFTKLSNNTQRQVGDVGAALEVEVSEFRRSGSEIANTLVINQRVRQIKRAQNQV